jgi:UDPglucose 6-dehydrogenase
LARQGAKVKAYDPEASEEAKPDVNNRLQNVNDLESAAKHSDAVLIVTDWAEFTDTPVDQYAGLMRGKLFVDGMNCFDPEAIKAAGLQYIGVGRG